MFVFKTKNKLLLVVLVLGISAIMRGFYIYNLNKPFIQVMDYDKNLGKAKYYSKEEGYIFKYKKADFFNADSFASVSTEDDVKEFMDDAGNIYTRGMHIVLFFWPNENQLGLYFLQNDPDININEQIYVDKELRYQSLCNNREYDQYAVELLENNKGKIEKLYTEAKRKWNLQ